MPDVYDNAGCINKADYNSDGFPDVFIGNQSVSNDFGRIPSSVLLRNNRGKLEAVQEDLFGQLGMVTDACWVDYNQDGNLDLVVVGEWMSPIFLANKGGKFVKDEVLESSEKGLWQSIMPYDIDRDGDMDFLLGNWGLNSKFIASKDFPMLMYYGDLDANGSTETIVAIQKNGKYYPTEGLDMLSKQLVSLRKKFTSYHDFAGKTVEEVLSEKMLKRANLLQVERLESGYLSNEDGRYSFKAFDRQLQVSPILSQLKHDFDGDGNEEVLVCGNYFGVQPYHGRFGSFDGALIKSNSEILSGKDIGLHLFNHSVRVLNIIEVGAVNYLLVTVNDDSAQVYKIMKHK